MAGKVDMGEARRRGDYEARKSEAIDAGRVKRPRISKTKDGFGKQNFSGLMSITPELALFAMYAAMSKQKHWKR